MAQGLLNGLSIGVAARIAVFEGSAGWLRLGIDAYQFPENVDDAWDSNWLVVRGEAALGSQRWSFRDPCLTTFELARLADWLDQAVAGNANEFCGFTEPNLEFRRLSDTKLRIGFSLEAQPPWAELKGDFGEHGFEMPIDAGLGAVAETLRQLLTDYPVRAPAPRP